ncbi:uncharacterized protein LOC126883858 [Diabrotica virgifera virgifera]|uniref:Uncharacterized protein n=1 Tax=Diabrotica virgifera virgifera TaxID=50390 RepID=A0ABM5K5M2_DIAVI|nr:uncharacterized protein LOC126883858 [Diabrotica virgifera virgifera]
MYKIVIFVAVSAVLILSVNAYEFNNADYNRIIADEIDNFERELYVPSVRTRREAPEDEKCPPRKHKLCCGEELIHKLHHDKKDSRSECFKQIMGKEDNPNSIPHDPFDCKSIEERQNKFLCVLQCEGQKNNIIDDDGNIKPEEYRKYIQTQLADVEYLADVQDKIIAGCLADIKNASKSSGKCKSDGMVSEFCVFKNIQLNCPEDQIKDKMFCEKMRERLRQENGRPMVLPPPPPHPKA